MVKETFGFILGEFGKGGQETQLKYLTTQMQKEKRQCCVIVWNYEENKSKYAEELQDAGVRLLLLNNESIFRKIFLSRLFLNKNQAATLHSFTHYLNFFAWCICLFSIITAIGGIRSSLKRVRREYGFLRFWINGILPIRKISNNQLYRFGMKSPLISIAFRSTKIITNHLDIHQFDFKKPKKERIIKTASIARLFPAKSLHVLIDAIYHLKIQGYNIQHIHAGTGKLQSALETLIDSKNLQENFLFFGETNDVSGFLKDKYLFILSSSYEGYPNVIMEAMACGKAIVSTDCGDVKYLVEDRVNGFIVPVGDSLAMSNAVEILVNDYSKLLEFSENSRKKAEKEFQLSHLVSETLKAYSMIRVENNW